MFYPVESLKKGGRFYLCWVADSWPLRFATITHRQLWSQDIRRICEDLLEVMTNESGRPTKRFSLRLSSQLMRGLVRLYQKKVTIFLGELCMLNANVTKHVNKKFLMHEECTSPRPALPRILILHPENVEGVEEMIQRSGNAVANIEDITLKESALPELQPLLNDNFGEMQAGHPLQLLADKTLEMMLAQDVSVAQQSLELLHDMSADKSHDKSRLAPHGAQMERISEHDVTPFKISVGDELLAIDEDGKEIPGIPDLSETLPPALLDPQPDLQVHEKALAERVVAQERVAETARDAADLLVLEELEEMEPPAKRRRMRGKIVDKWTKLKTSYYRERINNVAVELRCKNSFEDIVDIRVPSHILLTRAAAAGPRVTSRLGCTLSGLFARNLGVVRRPLADRDIEEVLLGPRSRHSRGTMLARIEEETEPVLGRVDKSRAEAEYARYEEPQVDISGPSVQDIADQPTQVIPTLSQQPQKRTMEREVLGSPKAPRRSGYVSLRESQHLQQMADIESVPRYETDKENVPDIPQELRGSQTKRGLSALTSMLQEVGLADLPPKPSHADVASPRVAQQVRRISDCSETPLGSLDRTKVSLGDSDRTTDSKYFIRDQWGTEGTMIKIIRCVKDGLQPLTVHALVARGPVMVGYERIITARCFTSILKLKQHRFINVDKDAITLEIKHITLGAKFE